MHVKSPYNPQFVGEAKALGGKWNPNGGTWIFDPRTEDRVRKLLKSIYGTDEIEYRSANVRLDAGAWWRHDTVGNSAACYFGGRLVLSRKFRDSRVMLGEGVILVDGGFNRSGGSTRYPSLNIDEGQTFVEVYDVPIDHPDLKDPSATIIYQEEAPEVITELTVKSSLGDYALTISAHDLTVALELALAMRPGRVALLASMVNIKQLDSDGKTTQESMKSGYIHISTIGIYAPIALTVDNHEPPEWLRGRDSNEVNFVGIPIVSLDVDEARKMLGTLA
jgi:hypothetical protein